VGLGTVQWRRAAIFIGEFVCVNLTLCSRGYGLLISLSLGVACKQKHMTAAVQPACRPQSVQPATVAAARVPLSGIRYPGTRPGSFTGSM